jgi:hypothetical protein
MKMAMYFFLRSRRARRRAAVSLRFGLGSLRFFFDFVIASKLL